MEIKKQRVRRAGRVRIRLTKSWPRLTVFRSGRHIWVQIVDDVKSRTIAAASSKQVESPPPTKVAVAREVGRLIARLARSRKIKRVVFDRGSYQYHGRVKALAEGAREGGLIF